MKRKVSDLSDFQETNNSTKRQKISDLTDFQEGKTTTETNDQKIERQYLDFLAQEIKHAFQTNLYFEMWKKELDLLFCDLHDINSKDLDLVDVYAAIRQYVYELEHLRPPFERDMTQVDQVASKLSAAKNMQERLKIEQDLRQIQLKYTIDRFNFDEDRRAQVCAYLRRVPEKYKQRKQQVEEETGKPLTDVECNNLRKEIMDMERVLYESRACGHLYYCDCE